MERYSVERQLWLKYEKRIYKRIAGKPRPIQLLMYRTYGSAVAILALLQELSFQALTMEVYRFGLLIQSKKYTRAFESQMELASIQPDKFLFSLHSFYNTLTNRARREKDMAGLVEFLSRVIRAHHERQGAVEPSVVEAYISMALQTLEYIRPNKFDLEQCVCGVSASGGLMTSADPFAFSDSPLMDAELSEMSGCCLDAAEKFRRVTQAYAQLGFPIRSQVDLIMLINAQRLHIHTTAALLPLINERTLAIVPHTTYQSAQLPLAGLMIMVDIQKLAGRLRWRRRVLPSEGVWIHFKDPSEELKQLLLQETTFQGSVYCLYRIDLTAGSLAGYYHPAEGFFYSATKSARDGGLWEVIRSLVLALYASLVLDDMPPLSELFRRNGQPMSAFLPGESGELRKSGSPQRLQDLGDFEYRESRVVGHIRRLPSGATATDEARTMAAHCGYELKAHETYVQSFTRQSLVRSSKETVRRSGKS